MYTIFTFSDIEKKNKGDWRVQTVVPDLSKAIELAENDAEYGYYVTVHDESGNVVAKAVPLVA